MYNMLKNKMNTYFFNSNIVKSYLKVCDVEGKEEVYYKKNKPLAILVKDQEVGERLSRVLKRLKDDKVKIDTIYATFQVEKIIFDKEGRVEFFYLSFIQKELWNIFEDWNVFSDTEQLQEMAAFVASMQDAGFILDDTIFESEKCDCISALLSFFKEKEEEEETFNNSFIELIHYRLSDGKDFKDFYQEKVSKNVCSLAEFPYKLPIIKMCYEYFSTDTFNGDICQVLAESQKDEFEGFEGISNYQYVSSIILDRDKFESEIAKVEENNEYIIYDGNIKIYHNMSSEYKVFLIDVLNQKKSYSAENVFEKIDTLIFDNNEYIIGYKFSMKPKNEKCLAILDSKFKNQREILVFIDFLQSYISSKKIKEFTPLKTREFNIENSLICIAWDSAKNYSLGIETVNDLFNLNSASKEDLDNQITILFFKLLLAYLKDKYGEMTDEKQFLEKEEVRYLSPLLTKEFINFALQNIINSKVANELFFNFLHNTGTKSAKCNIFYDSRFEYNPSKVPFIFDYEVEQQYGIKLKKGIEEELPKDEGTLITFSGKTNISTFKSNEDIKLSNLSSRIGRRMFQDGRVSASSVSKIVYSSEIDNNGMYVPVGYITKSLKGKPLTDDELLKLSNKDFLYIAGYLLTKFQGNYVVPLKSIYMDGDFNFYIDVNDENFEIERKDNKFFTYYATNFVEYVAEYMHKRGYNKFAFEDVDLSSENSNYFIKLADSLDTFCNEHNIFYNSSLHMCPVCLKTKFPVESIENKITLVFEDEYAKHYRIDDELNIKLYDTSKVDIKSLEETIDKIILNKCYFLLQQEAFIPCKKAIDSENRCIGYVYKAVDFGNNNPNSENACINLNDIDNLANLPRIKLLIRLIEQVQFLVNHGYGFTKNPFGNVFLVREYKKQVQILNIDFIKKNVNLDNTWKWTREYVSKIIVLDDNIDDSVFVFSNLDKMRSKLVSMSKELTKYCSYHKVYYKKEYLFCPKCIDKKTLRNLPMEYVESSSITSLQQINEGGESFIYSYDSNSVAKVFKEDNINIDLKNKIIARLMSKKEILEEINRNGKLKYKFIIPQKLFVDTSENKVFGYLMNKVNGTPISALRDTAQVKNLGLTKKDIFEILITVGEGIETLHSKANIYIGDLNGRNILFDRDKNVYFLDFDGMGIDNIAPDFCTDGYIDPISKKNKNITMKDDWYSFAVQAFYYLTFTHPFNGIYSVFEKGQEVKLDIVDKMERRISLLGNHGMKPPKVAEPWNWMEQGLKLAFLSIFEGTNRESIVPQLAHQYEKLYNCKFSSLSNYNLDKYFPVNDKFLATTKQVFPSNNVVRVINQYSAIHNDVTEKYISILGEPVLSDAIDFDGIENVIVARGGKIAFIIYADQVIAFNVEDEEEIYRHEISNSRNVVVNENCLYFDGVSDEGENVIFKVTFDIANNLFQKEEVINFLTDQETKALMVMNNSKFVVVKKVSGNLGCIDEIYCNSQKISEINCNSEYSNYKIIYDKLTKKWLVINDEGNGIIINSTDGTCENINVRTHVNEEFILENITFNNGHIYIPANEMLYIINTKNQNGVKKMECHLVMTPNSKICSINANGFTVLTENIFYDVMKKI